MIRFDFGNDEYTINFLYKQRGKVSTTRLPESQRLIDLPDWDRKGACLMLCCVRSGAIGSRDDDKSLVSVGVAFTHPNDRFVKETGRKTALMDALIWSPKALRTAAWDAYNNRSKVRSKQTA